MAEHIVAIFSTDAAADAAARDLDGAGISPSSIRRYRPTSEGSNSHFAFSVGGGALSHICRHDGCQPGGAALREALEAVSQMRE